MEFGVVGCVKEVFAVHFYPYLLFCSSAQWLFLVDHSVDTLCGYGIKLFDDLDANNKGGEKVRKLAGRTVVS